MTIAPERPRQAAPPAPPPPAPVWPWFVLGLAILIAGAALTWVALADGDSPVGGGAWERETLEPLVYADGVTGIEVFNVSGDISYTVAADEGVTVERTIRWHPSEDRPEVRQELVGDYLSLSHEDCNECEVLYAITGPAAIELTASSVSGNVSIDGVERSMSLSTISGNINVDAGSGSLMLNSVSGNLNADQLTSPTVTANTTSGHVVLSFSAEPSRVNVTGVSGNVTVELTGGPYNVTSVASVSGNTSLSVDTSASSERTISVTSVSGNVRVVGI